jgi:predicted NACHT family NTPase
MDYVDQLSDKEKEWLTAFVREEVLADFAHTGKKLNKTKKAKREIYNKNNASNRCIYSLNGIKTARSGEVKIPAEEVAAKWRKYEATKDEVEDAMIDLIDLRSGKKIEESEE